MSKVYSALEISRHNCEKDIWIVIDGGVYDLTKFLKEHPGGEEVLLNLAGQDGTKCFAEIGHSGEATALRETFKIGVISYLPSITPGTIETTTLPISDDDGDDDKDWKYEEPTKESSPYLPIFISISILMKSH
ncbi:cytochrome b5-like isoform X2 [Belonocnema kinseyi]|uniref:cytochrome b5-like isoform X2 n=1 Tax=Belonocnema kinseyi TaxID=2817044 RepID=UPI00143D698C|nr:cytochrome b5-like isoform X2 [Belonocnema kinseyi]